MLAGSCVFRGVLREKLRGEGGFYSSRDTTAAEKIQCVPISHLHKGRPPLHIDSFLKRLGGWGSPDINQIEIEIEPHINILTSNFDLL